MLSNEEKSLILQQTDMQEEDRDMIIHVSQMITDSLESVKIKHSVSDEALAKMVEVYSKCNFHKILAEKESLLEMMLEDENQEAIAKLMFWVFSEVIYRFVDKNGGDTDLSYKTRDLINKSFDILHKLEVENPEIMDSLDFGFGSFPEME